MTNDKIEGIVILTGLGACAILIAYQLIYKWLRQKAREKKERTI